MEMIMAATPSTHEDDTILSIKAGADERIEIGQSISIELTDGTYTERKIMTMERWFCPEGAKRGKWKKVFYIENGESAEVLIKDIKSNTIQTTSMPRREWFEKFEKMICLTPYKEILGGEESIYEHVSEGYSVPDKVITYLKIAPAFLMSPGVYDHPFKDNTRLLGPYLYSDDTYYWDRDTWKYVVKYGLELPQDFIDHVMSDEGTKFIEESIKSDDSWSEVILNWKDQKGFLCLLPDDAGDKALEDF